MVSGILRISNTEQASTIVGEEREVHQGPVHANECVEGKSQELKGVGVGGVHEDIRAERIDVRTEYSELFEVLAWGHVGAVPREAH